jgi:sugar phosphate permease
VCLFLLACLAAGLTALALVPDPSPALATALWGVCGFGLLGPFSLLGGAVSVDVGGRNAAGVAAGVVDGIGYVAGAALGGVGAAAVVQARGWSTAFGVMAGASALAVVAAWRLTRAEDRARAAAQRAPAAGAEVTQENVG